MREAVHELTNVQVIIFDGSLPVLKVKILRNLRKDFNFTYIVEPTIYTIIWIQIIRRVCPK